LERGAGRVQVERIPYVVDKALAVLRAAGNLVLVGAREPVAFFAYPDKPSLLMAEGTRSSKLAGIDEDIEGALEALAAELGATKVAPARLAAPRRPALPQGAITPAAIASVLGASLPEDAIVVDESVSTGREFFPETAGAPPHDWLNNRGGSIGYGMPVAIGAAIACPRRKVLALVGDGSAMYTLQSLWTMAREALDVTVLILANGSYNILRGELASVGVKNPGPPCGRHAFAQASGPRLGWPGTGHGRAGHARQGLRAVDQGRERGPAVRGTQSRRGGAVARKRASAALERQNGPAAAPLLAGKVETGGAIGHGDLACVLVQ
jgi:thiamine pyrophosphate-dependent acetolactate synthase large subunit-like protein